MCAYLFLEALTHGLSYLMPVMTTFTVCASGVVGIYDSPMVVLTRGFRLQGWGIFHGDWMANIAIRVTVFKVTITIAAITFA